MLGKDSQRRAAEEGQLGKGSWRARGRCGGGRERVRTAPALSCLPGRPDGGSPEAGLWEHMAYSVGLPARDPVGCGEHVACSVGLPDRDSGTSCSPAAQAALVKSRDMHWSLLAQRGQRDVSLSSLRLLIVADGANPCEYCPPPNPGTPV